MAGSPSIIPAASRRRHAAGSCSIHHRTATLTVASAADVPAARRPGDSHANIHDRPHGRRRDDGVGRRPGAGRPVSLHDHDRRRRRRRMGLPGGRPGLSPALREPRDEGRRHRHRGQQGRRRDRGYPGRARLRDCLRARPRLREQRPREQGEHRRPEDAEDDPEGGHRREPRRDPLRTGAQGGLHDERARQVRHRLRRRHGQGRRDHSARRESPSSPRPTRRRARST